MTHSKGGWSGDSRGHRDAQKRRTESLPETYWRRAGDRLSDASTCLMDGDTSYARRVGYAGGNTVWAATYALATLFVTVALVVTIPVRWPYRYLRGDR